MMKYLNALIPLLCLFSGTESASATGGTIRFTGAIVEEGCNINVKQGAVQTACFHNGRWQRQSSEIQPLLLTAYTLPNNAGTTRLQWLDKQHQLGVLTVEYR
ncbi:hypothetical protein PMPD1_2922 [Paramixta manurensis]|uniref:Type 1 fimbrial protein n=1 Tax=Paramixta manurensis TaxID=2740817 RepID=A0A6M8UDL8_9GAMM|nr:hypothetical protein PMPD1_2922 [Erwiniaceae bacterium PD-1]